MLDSRNTRCVQINSGTLIESFIVFRKKESGRLRVTTSAQDRKLCISIKRHRFKPITRLYQLLAETCGVQVSARTSTRPALTAGLRAARSAWRIPLSAQHGLRRKRWCMERLSWAEEWHQVLWTDESGFCLHFVDGRLRVRRLTKSGTQPVAFVSTTATTVAR